MEFDQYRSTDALHEDLALKFQEVLIQLVEPIPSREIDKRMANLIDYKQLDVVY
jgi:hypothetical protein